MKKVLLIAAVVGIGFASCKKDYTCVCTSKDNGTVVGTSEITFKAKKKDAKAACDINASSSGGGSTSSTTCELK